MARIPALVDFCRDEANGRVCERMWELGGENWRGAEHAWNDLIDTALNNIHAESTDERIATALADVRKAVMGRAG
jgi:hypothetical protein